MPEPVLVATVGSPVPVRPAPVFAPTPTPPPPVERRLSFDGVLPSSTVTPRPTPRGSGVSWTTVGSVVALVVVVLAAALFVSRRSSEEVTEAIADAGLPMTTDAEAKAAMADVVAAQAAHFKSRGAYTAAPLDLRAAASKAPLRKGFAPDGAGAVYVDAPRVRPGDEPVFYLAARAPSGSGCLYVKGVPDGTSEGTSADCMAPFGVDFGPSPQARRAATMILTAADMGPGWRPAASNGTKKPWTDPDLAACLSVPAVEPPGSTGLVGFTRGLASVRARVAVWLSDEAAKAGSAAFDHPQFATCTAEGIREEFAGDGDGLFDRVRMTVTERGALSGRADVRYSRIRLDGDAFGGTGTLWSDIVHGTRGRTEAVVIRFDSQPPDHAETLRLVDAMLARG
ncbi:MAG TPA: hypothetical protein VM938_04400 [Acidimicrobiales bacterium]|nr:hypothetical protein [Acidimicrobiales bacterium]